ncbi:hypothetical protein ACFQ1S_02710, partial [Kibdelosporangium lantanae]
MVRAEDAFLVSQDFCQGCGVLEGSEVAAGVEGRRVVGAEDFGPNGKIDRNQFRTFFVRVPQGATGLKIDMNAGGAAGKGQ